MPQVIGPAVASLVALAAPTSVALGASGPVLVGSALVVSQAITAGILIGGSLLVQGLLAPSGPRQPKPETAKQTFEAADAPHNVILGRARVGGNVLFKAAKDNVLYIVTEHAIGPIEGIEEVYVNGRTVTVEENGEVSSPPYGKVGGADWLSVKTKFGTDGQITFGDLALALPDYWTDAHRGRGRFLSLLICRSPGAADTKHFKIYRGEPAVEFLARGPAMFDPRTGTSAWSDNGVLAVLHHLTLPRSRGGWGEPLSRFALDDIAIEATKADELVALKGGGTERRVRVAGSYTTDMSTADVLASLLLSTGTQILPMTDGRWTIRIIEDNPAPTVTLDIGSMPIFDWLSGPEGTDRYNRARCTFYSAERRYDVGDVPLSEVGWANYQDEVNDVGERFMDLSLPFCPSHRQAAVITRRLFSLARSPRGEVTMGVAGLMAMGHAHARIPFPDLSESFVANIDAPRLEDNGVQVTVPFIERLPLAEWDASRDEPDPPDILPEIADGDAPDAPDLGQAILVPRSGGTQLRVRFTKDSDTEAFEVVWRDAPVGGLPGTWMSASEYEQSSTVGWGYDNAATLGDPKQVRARVAEGVDEAPSEWSDITTLDGSYPALTPDAPIVTIAGGANPRTVTVETTDIAGCAYTLERRLNGGSWSTVASGDIAPWAPASLSQTLAAGIWDYRARMTGPTGLAGAYGTASLSV